MIAKLIGGNLVFPPNPYPIIIDGISAVICLDYNNLTDEQKTMLLADGWKELIYDYESTYTWVEETETQIIQHYKKVELTDEQKFDSQVCIDGLFRKFITSLAVFCSVSAPLVQLMQGKKPDNDGSYYNYFWCIKIYLVQVKNKDMITQADYDRVLSVFAEQNINLENY